MDREYITSGRYIHDELLRRCDPLINKLPKMWREQKQKIYPALLAWPHDSVSTIEGERFTGVVFTELPEELQQRKQHIKNATAQCDAFAVLVSEQLEDSVRVIFESKLGTRTWHLPIKDHGDVRILGRPTWRDNSESLGVLWHAS